jgi:hypothetical protein
MDKINAPIRDKYCKHIALENLKAMNKKFVFTVVLNGLRRMAPTRVSRTTGVTTASGNF